MKPKHIVSLVAIIVVSLLVSLGADAAEKSAAGPRQNFQPKRPLGTRDPGVNARQANQARRIGQGVKSGQLTPQETKGLVEQQKAIRQEERQYKSDGTLTKAERIDLHKDLNEASRDIYREKHDDEKMAWARPDGTYAPGVNVREVEQWHRIFTGMRSGQLTWREASRLVKEEELLARLERRMKSDGTLTPAERVRLQTTLNELSASIYKQKHDAQHR